MDKEKSIVVDLFNGYALAFFFTMGLGSIMIQLHNLIKFELLYNLGTTLTAITGPVIGMMIGIKLGLSAVACGSLMMAGAIAQYKSNSPALMAFTLCILIGILLRQIGAYMKFNLDVFLMPVISIAIAYLACKYGEPYLAKVITIIVNEYVKWESEGTIIAYLKMAVTSGILFTSPVGLTNIAFVVNFSRIGLIASTCGVISFMVGFAFIGIFDNTIGTSLAVGIGTSAFQFGNLIRRPLIIVPPIIATCVGTVLAYYVDIIPYTSSVNAMKFGTCALYAYIDLFTVNDIIGLLPIIVVFMLIPAGVSLGTYMILKKVNLIHDGDLTINL